MFLGGFRDGRRGISGDCCSTGKESLCIQWGAREGRPCINPPAGKEMPSKVEPLIHSVLVHSQLRVPPAAVAGVSTLSLLLVL